MARIKWILDPAYSEILFKVKHMMITNVKGEFRKFTGEVFSEDTYFDPETIKLKIDASSIDSNNDDRDKHLKSADFFDVENHKELIFVGENMKNKDDDEFQLTGDLTMKGITKKVTLDVEFGGVNKDPWGNEKAGFSLEGKLNRKDWGLNWNSTLETGGVLVSDEVKISAEIQFIKQEQTQENPS